MRKLHSKGRRTRKTVTLSETLIEEPKKKNPVEETDQAKMEFVPLDCIKQEPEETLITEEIDIKPDSIEDITIPTASSETLAENYFSVDNIKQETSPPSQAVEDITTGTEFCKVKQEDCNSIEEVDAMDAELASEVEEELGSELEKEESENDVEPGHDLGEGEVGETEEFVLQDNDKNGEFVIVQNSDAEEALSNSDWEHSKDDIGEESEVETEFSGHFLAPILQEEEEDMEYQPLKNVEENASHQQDISPYKCEICDEVLSDQLLLIFHINEKHSDMCLISSDQLEVAVRANLNCNKVQKNKNIYNFMPGNIKCKLCSCLFLTKIGLDKHTERFHKNVYEDIIECPICFRVFKNNIAFNFHLKTAHKSEENSKKNEVSKKQSSSECSSKRRRITYSKEQSESESSGDEYEPKESSSSSSDSSDDDPTWTCSNRKSSSLAIKTYSSANPRTSLSATTTTLSNLNKLQTTNLVPRIPTVTSGTLSTNSILPGAIVQAGSLTGVPVSKQQIQIVKNKDGSLKVVGGLLPGQQLLQLPNGTLKIVCTSNPLPPGTLTPVKLAAAPSINSPFLLQPGTSAPIVLKPCTTIPTTLATTPLILKSTTLTPSTSKVSPLVVKTSSSTSSSTSSTVVLQPVITSPSNPPTIMFKTTTPSNVNAVKKGVRPNLPPALTPMQVKKVSKTYSGPGSILKTSSRRNPNEGSIIKLGTMSKGQVNVLLVDDDESKQAVNTIDYFDTMQNVVSKIVSEREKQKSLDKSGNILNTCESGNSKITFVDRSISGSADNKPLSYKFLNTNPIPKKPR